MAQGSHMSQSTESQATALLGDAVRTAEEVTEDSVEDSVIGVIDANLTESDRVRILELYDEGTIAEETARKLVGDGKFEDAIEKSRGAEMMLSGDSSRFVSE